MPRSKQRFFQIVLLLLALLFGLLICEAGTRIFLSIKSPTLVSSKGRLRAPNGANLQFYDTIALSRNPRLIYETIPNRYGRFLGAEYRTNSHGMRQGEVAVKKPANTFRIATLGDSTMFGWGVGNGENYPAVLERALNSVGDKRRYEVLSFGIPGYNTAMEAEQYITRVKAFSPDLLALQFDINDLALPNFVADTPNFWSLRRSWFLSLLKGIIVERNATATLARLAAPTLNEGKRGTFQTKSGLVDYWEYRAERAPKEYRYMVGWTGVKRALDRLWANTREPILHLSMPYPIDQQDIIKEGSEDQYARHVKEAARKDPRLFYEDISHYADAFARGLNIAPRKDLVVDYPTDLHPAREGHILIARAIYLSLIKNHLLPHDSAHYEKSNEVAKALWDEALGDWQKRPRQVRKSKQ